MKKILVVASLSVLSLSAFASERVVAGNIFFEGQGYVSANKVCFDKNQNVYKTTIPAQIVETCSNANLPVFMCAQNGGKVIRSEIPARELIAQEFVVVKECTKFDYSVATQPKCLSFEEVEVEQPVDYTFGKYSVAISNGYDAPATIVERDIAICK